MTARRIGTALAALLVLCLPALAGEAGYEDLLKQMLKTFERMTTTLSAVQDSDGAKAAKPELKAALKTFLDARKKAEEARPPDRAEKERLTKAYKPKLDESLKKLFLEIRRVEAIPGGRDALKEVNAVLGREDK